MGDGLEEDKMSGDQNGIMKILHKVYGEKLYPSSADFSLEESVAEEATKAISLKCQVNTEFKHCDDCHYCYQIAISEAKEIPILPDYSKNDDRRKLWIRHYGGVHYQMYLALRLALVEALQGPEPLPLILDDPFLTFDRPRLGRVLAILGELAVETQIILATKDEILRDEARAVGMRVERLGG